MKMTKTEIENKIYDLKRTIKSCENIIKANENEIKKLEAEKEKVCTKERAEEVADKINFLLRLERLHDTFCPDYKPDWDDKSKAKWCVVFDYDENEYVSYWNTVIDNRTIVYFDSIGTAKKVCKILNKEIKNN